MLVFVDESGDLGYKFDRGSTSLNSEQRQKIRQVRLSRSSSDPLIQLSDYVAGVTNRLYEGKPGADQYDAYLRRKRRSQRKWP